MALRIRPAGADDADEIRSLIATMGYDVDAGEIRDRLRHLPAFHGVLVAQHDSGVVGWVHVLTTHSLIAGTRAEIGGISVAPHAQGNGVGSALLRAAEIWAEQQGVSTVHLRSRSDRHPAHAFYLARGYRIEKAQLAFTKTTGGTTDPGGGAGRAAPPE